MMKEVQTKRILQLKELKLSSKRDQTDGKEARDVLGDSRKRYRAHG